MTGVESKPTVAVDLRALLPEPTGIGVYTRSLLEALVARGHYRFLGMAHRPPRDLDQLLAAGVAVETQGMPLGVLWQQLRLPLRLRRGDVDLLWSPLNTLPRWLPVPGVVTVHDLTALLFPETHRLKVRLSILPFLHHTLRQASAVIAISEATAADLRQRFPGCGERLHVVHNGIDPVFRAGTAEEIEAVRDRLACPRGYLLYAGTLEPRKNVERLLDAWQLLRQRRPDTPPLLLAGAPGWRNTELVARIASLGPEVRHLGHLERRNLVRLFQGASAFVYPSLYEGFGLPPAEAMACGVPVVTSNVSSLPEVVGDAGLQVDPTDPAALAAAIARILDQPELAAELRRRGLERAQLFSWTHAAEQLEEIFQRVLGAGGESARMPMAAV